MVDGDFIQMNIRSLQSASAATGGEVTPKQKFRIQKIERNCLNNNYELHSAIAAACISTYSSSGE